MIKSRCVVFRTLALIEHLAIPFEAETFQSVENIRCGPWDFPVSVDILHSHDPLTLVGACIEIAAHSSNQRSEVQGACGRRGKPAAVAGHLSGVFIRYGKAGA